MNGRIYAFSEIGRNSQSIRTSSRDTSLNKNCGAIIVPKSIKVRKYDKVENNVIEQFCSNHLCKKINSHKTR